MKTTRALSFLVTVWLAVAIAVSMAAYAFYQYFTMPGMTVTDLFLHHLWHVLGLGAVIYVLCWVIFDRALVQPLKRIYLHLYAVGAGKLELLELRSNVTEIHTIVGGINLMLYRLKRGADTSALELAQQRIEEIRGIATRLGTQDQATVGAMLEALAELEKGLAALAQSRSDQPANVPAVTTEGRTKE